MGIRQLARSALRRFGWDVVRYAPQRQKVTNSWPSLEALDIRTVIDVGAFDGDTGRIFRRMWPNAEMHCFEPQAVPYARLEAWASRQNGSVHTYKCALGSTRTTATLNTPGDSLRMASIVRMFDGASPTSKKVELSEIAVERLDDVLDASTLADGIFVKIDVEGFEREVIRGGSGVLNRTVACMVEVHTRMTPSETADLAEMAQLMQSHGLTFAGIANQVFGANDRYVYGDVVFANWSRCATRSAPRA